MIQEDDPNHRRLRGLVRKAFRPQAIARLEARIEAHCHELLDGLEKAPGFELQSRYALPIPMRMIGDMMGVKAEVMPVFQQSLSVLTEGFSGWRMLKTLFRDLPRTIAFIRKLVEAKRADPGDDILTV